MYVSQKTWEIVAAVICMVIVIGFAISLYVFDFITFEDTISCGDGAYLKTTSRVPVCPYCKKGTLRWFEDTKVFEIENSVDYDVDGTYYNNWVRVDVYRCSDCNSVYYVEKYQDKKKYVENIDTVKNWVNAIELSNTE